MLKKFEHVGIATADLDRCLKFYVDLLGMDLILRKPMHIGGEVAFVGYGGRQILEIFAPETEMKEPAREVPKGEVGARHIALTFESVDQTYEKLMAAGVESVEAPRDAHNREFFKRIAFVKDSDGIIIELIE